MSAEPTHSGGCQCGAIRFRVEGPLGDASVCHCRMCQKASGNFYLSLVSVRDARLVWTRGAPQRFQSSNHGQRGFGSACGTPLTYEAPDGTALTIGSFDRPQEIAPRMQWGVENKLPYVDGVPALPGEETLADAQSAPFLTTLVSYQHPDHDTTDWPEEGRAR